MSPWIWIAAGIILAAAEMVLAGVYLLWIGIAAAVVGLLLLVVPTLSTTTQLVAFAILAVVAALLGQFAYRRLYRGATDRPALNRRAEQLVGRRAILDQPIVNGLGRIRLDDTTWRVRGPDLAAGTQVEVTGAENATLVVIAVP